MPLIDCEIDFNLTFSEDWVISSAYRETKYAVTDTKLYVPVVTLSTQDNVKRLKQLESSFNGIITKLTGINTNQKCE